MTETTKTALAVTETDTKELAPTSAQAIAKHEIESAIVIANRFPRNEDAAYASVMRSCSRPGLAALACYSYPRGGSQIKGPSVNLAREIARCWGNIRYGCDVVQDDDESRTVRGWAWDIQTNTKETQDATFKKLVYRKKGGWIAPDERDLRELTNKQGAICVRNCLLHLVPPDLVEDAVAASRQAIEKDMGTDPEQHRKKMILAFQGIGVKVEELEVHLGHSVRQATPTELTDLRTIWKSISDGNSIWAEYMPDTQPAPAEGSGATLDDLAAKPKKKAPKKKKPEEPDPELAELQSQSARREEEFRDLIKQADKITEVNGLLHFIKTDAELNEQAQLRVSKLAELRSLELAREDGP